MPYTDEPISIIEDLDPEPQSSRGGRQFWEVVLGLLILAGVLAFAGWQWYRQEVIQANYASAVQAAIDHRWEDAHSLFAAASGYHDADSQAQAAAAKIGIRDNQYQVALASRDAGNWAACLKSIKQVNEIQFGYKDALQIQARADEHVYNDALSGTVALRPGAYPPGLYYYGQNGWSYLPRSDAFSRVLGQNSNGSLLYDVPGQGWTPPSVPAPTQNIAGSPNLSGRRLMLAPLSKLNQAKELTLDPSLYNIFQLTNDGVWALRNDDTWSMRSGNYRWSTRSPVGFGYTGLNGDAILFEHSPVPLTDTMALPDAISDPNFYPTILAFDPNSSRYLISRPRRAVQGAFTLQTTLYLGQAGGNLTSVFSMQGGALISAQFSPDGRYALLNTSYVVTSKYRRNELLLLDLQGQRPQLTLASSLSHPDLPSSLGIAPWLTGAFLYGGPYEGDIFLADYTGHAYRLRVFDISTTSVRLVDLFLPSDFLINWTIHPGTDTMSLVSGQQVTPDGYPLVEVPLWVVSLSSDKATNATSSTITRLTNLVNNYLDSAMVAGDRLSYSTHEPEPSGRDMRSVFSFPTRRFGIEGENPWTMFKQAEYANGKDLFSTGDYSFGPTLFAYVSGTDLHARLYDGSVDITLEPHVTYLYDTNLHYPTHGPLR
jgi:hypothetical protein